MTQILVGVAHARGIYPRVPLLEGQLVPDGVHRAVGVAVVPYLRQKPVVLVYFLRLAVKLDLTLRANREFVLGELTSFVAPVFEVSYGFNEFPLFGLLVPCVARLLGGVYPETADVVGRTVRVHFHVERVAIDAVGDFPVVPDATVECGIGGDGRLCAYRKSTCCTAQQLEVIPALHETSRPTESMYKNILIN